jgi:small subunit ribosomal protein S18
MNRFYSVFPEKTRAVDFKDIDRLSKFLTEKGKIMPRRITGLTSKQQRLLARAIKRARHSGLIGFVSQI